MSTLFSGNAVASSSSTAQTTDLWSDILRSADRSNRGRGTSGRKNLLVLSERHHGRRYLLDQLLTIPLAAKRRKTRTTTGVLAMGYEYLEVRDDGDEDSIPPVSVFYPPSSDPTLLDLVPVSLPPKSLADTAVVVVLDWTKPSSMVKELVRWLCWAEEWASTSAERGQAEDMRDRLQSHLQHYAEPASSTPAGSTSTILPYGGGLLLPLGPGILTLNRCGVPITVVCTRADLMDTVADDFGMKNVWEERTDWIQQVLRTICLSYGAALFHTASTQPQTYTLLRTYLLHRFYTIPPPLNPPSENPAPKPPSRFPFAHRANALDRDALMIPAGWDTWGKINILRDGFDPVRIGKAWEASLRRVKGEDLDEEGIEEVWAAAVPEPERFRVKPSTARALQTPEHEQTLLARQLETLLKDPNRDPRASFRNAAAVTAAATASSSSASDGGSGVVGPMGSGGLNLPGVEKAMMEMEGGTADDLKEKFARLGRRESSRGVAASPSAPTASTPIGGTTAVPNEALHNFFQGLLATKAKSSTGTPVATPSTKSMAPPPVPSDRTKPENG